MAFVSNNSSTKTPFNSYIKEVLKYVNFWATLVKEAFIDVSHNNAYKLVHMNKTRFSTNYLYKANAGIIEIWTPVYSRMKVLTAVNFNAPRMSKTKISFPT